MATTKASRTFLPAVLFFLILNSLFLFFRSRFEQWNTDTDVLVIGNLVLFIATIVSFMLYYKSLKTKNAYAIVRMVYGGVLTKMIICLAGIFIYISIAGKGVNKPAILGCMGLYIVYTVLEVAALMKLNKRKTNA